MKSAKQLFKENQDLVLRFSCDVSTRKYPATTLMPITEIFLKEAIRRFGHQNLQDFYYAAEAYVINHLALYIDTDGNSLFWDEDKIQENL